MQKSPETLRFPDKSGKSILRGYNAPCFLGVVHYLAGFAVIYKDTADRKDKIQSAYRIV